MAVYRIHIRPKGGLADPIFSFNYCLKEQVLGLGWQTGQNSGISWDEYEKNAIEIFGNRELSRVRYLKNNIKKDDLIWTRDTTGNYYLAKVLSEWEYYINSEAKDADIANVVRCDLLKVTSVNDVPGKIVACFRPSRTVQAIRNNTAVEYSKYLWNRLSKTDNYTLSSIKFGNIFSFLDAEETEDVIFIYLQTLGWIVVPNSRKADTMSYEFYLINKNTHEKAIVQVKTGHTPLSPDAPQWINRNEKVFLFQSSGIYKCDSKKNVICIEPDIIEDFMYNNQNLLPSNILHWLKKAKGMKEPITK
jgi:hypothetical protein